MTPSIEPLKGDPNRTAQDLHRGINFQLWLSVEAWLNLKEGELLFLEEAEDFDVVSADSGTAVQAKSTSSKITLRSKDVVDAIVNFWLVKKSNSSKKINFRFITTSEITAERSTLLNSDQPGLILWGVCAENRDLKLAENLQLFLANDPSISQKLNIKDENKAFLPEQTLLDFLQSSTPQEVLDQLITPIKWETDSVDEEVLKASIKMHLSAHGAKHGIFPSSCVGVQDRLFRVVADVAKKDSHRFLSLNDFRVEFESVTTTAVPNQELTALRSNNIFGAIRNEGSYLSSPKLSAILQGLPVLPSQTVQRKSVSKKIVEKLSSENTLIIRGSSGMGKSTVAVLAATQIGGNWIWADLHSQPLESIGLVIRGLAAHILSESSSSNLCLDNLNYSASDLALIDMDLAALIRVVSNGGGKVIITSQREIPIRVLGRLGLNKVNCWNIPKFNEGEIFEFILLLGCPNEKNPTSQAKLVQLHTSGHPRLVHARIAGLSDEGWPPPSKDDLSGIPREITEEKEISRQLLDGASDSEKELLYWLSLAIGPFRKDHAVSVAQDGPSLNFPTDSFNKLVGPWIDSIESGYYRISPLLHNAAVENWTSKKVNEARKVIGMSMLNCSDRTIVEANEALFQGFLCKDEEIVASVACALIKAPNDSWDVIADRLGWIVCMGRDGKGIFPNPTLNSFLRIIQFRVASILSSINLDELCGIVDEEISEFGASGEAKELAVMSWCLTVLITENANISPVRMVKYWQNLVELSPATREILEEQFGGAIKNPLDDLGGGSISSQLLMCITTRKMNPQGLVLFAKSINKLPDKCKTEAVEILLCLRYPLRLLVDRSWLMELDNNCTDWLGVIETYEGLRREIKDWGNSTLDASVVRIISVIYDEQLNDSARAIDLIQLSEKCENDSQYLISDQKANVHYGQKRYVEAVSIWQEILPLWTINADIPDSTPLYSCEKAACASSELSNLSQSVEFIQLGRNIALQLGDELHSLSFLADEAFARWKQGNKEAFLDTMFEVLKLIESCANFEADDFQWHRFYKSVEQVLKRCVSEVESDKASEEWEPPVGFCSRINVDQKLANYPKAHLDFMWMFLAQTEHKVRKERPILETAMLQVKTSKLAVYRCSMSFLAVKNALQNSDFSNILILMSALNQAMCDSQTQSDQGKGIMAVDDFITIKAKNSPEVMATVIIPSMIALKRGGKALKPCLSDWLKLEVDADVTSILSDVEAIITLPLSQLIELQQDDSSEHWKRSIASIKLLDHPEAFLWGLILGQAFLLAYIDRSMLRDEIEEDFGEICRDVWSYRIKFPVAFSTPRLTIPAIKKICESDETGLKLVATLLLQALSSTDLNVASEVLNHWRVLAK